MSLPALGSPSPATTSTATVSAPAPKPPLDAAAQARLAELDGTFGALFGLMRRAVGSPELWPQICARKDYAAFLLRVRQHLHSARAMGLGAHLGDPMLAAIAERCGLMAVELRELESAAPALLHRGMWQPPTARMQRVTVEAGTKESSDRVTAFLDAASRKILPGMKELPLGVLRYPYAVVDKALPCIDTAGKYAVTGIEAVANWLDGLGAPLRTKVQTRYRELHQGLSLSSVSDKKLRLMSDSEQEMALLAAGALRGVAWDVDQWMMLLADPGARRDPGVVGDLKAGVRLGLDAAAWLMHGMARTIHQLTDEQSWRLFSFRGEFGIGLEIAACATRAGVGVYFPSLAEVAMSSSGAKLRFESLYTPLATPVQTVELTSRGGKYAACLGPFSVRQAEFSKAMNCKLPGIGGFALQRDDVFGPGVEVGYSPKIGVAGLLNVRVMPEVAVFHPGLSALDGVVDTCANFLGNATETATDALSAVGSSVARAWRRLRGSEAPARPSHEVEARNRLGRTQLAVRRATVALGLVRSYTAELQRRRAEGKPLAERGSEAYARMTTGFSAKQAERVIEQFMLRSERRLSVVLERVHGLASGPQDTPFAERRRRAEIRGCNAELEQAEGLFAFADTLLAEIFAGAAWKPEGPFAFLVDEGKTAPAKEADAAPKALTFAPGIALGRTDWAGTRRPQCAPAAAST